MEEILRQFPDLTDNQVLQFQKLQSLYEDWNAKINLFYEKNYFTFIISFFIIIV